MPALNGFLVPALKGSPQLPGKVAWLEGDLFRSNTLIPRHTATVAEGGARVEQKYGVS